MDAPTIISTLTGAVTSLFGGFLADVLLVMVSLIGLSMICGAGLYINDILLGHGRGVHFGAYASPTFSFTSRVENLEVYDIYDGEQVESAGSITYMPQGSDHVWNGYSKGTNVTKWGSDAMPDAPKTTKLIE